MTTTPYDRVPEIVVQDDAGPLARRLQAIWETGPGIYGWLSSVDHKEIGIRYIVTAFAFLMAGGLEALIFRLQLSAPELRLLTPEQYNQLFTMHGATMILWYAFPVLTGFSVFLQPLVLGTRDMAFPRMNAFTYWVFLLSGIFLYVSFLFAAAPNAGWFNYTPYAARAFNPGLNIDFYALANILLGVSTTLGSINFIVTILRERAPGMSINRLPILSWGTLTISFGLIFSMPSVTLAFFFLWMDRQFGTHFLQSADGGQPLLWQHLFWMWGHPWVYAIVLPAISMISQILPVLCRRPLVGYTAVALATVMTMVLGFGVWLHHMFATGLSNMALAFFSAVSLLIVIPSAVSFFAWIATLWTGRPVIEHRISFCRRFHHRLRHRRRIGLHDRFSPCRLAADRHLFRRRSYSLRVDRLESVRGDGGDLLLVSKDDGPPAERASWPLEFLVHVCGVQSRLLSHAHFGPARHAAACIHVSRGNGLGHAQPDHDNRRLHLRLRISAARDQYRDQSPQRCDCRS